MKILFMKIFVCHNITSSQVLYSAMIVIAFTSLLQHFTVQWQGQNLVTLANAKCRVSPNICSYVAICYCVDQFLASFVWPDPIFMHLGAFILLTVQRASHWPLKVTTRAEQK